MFRIISLVFVLLIHLCAYSQKKDINVAMEYAKSITKSELKEHLYEIASDDYEGRETGKKGQKMAMRYLVENFKSLEIEELPKYGYLQSFPLIEQENRNYQLKINGKELKLFEDYYIKNTYLKDTTFSSDLYFIGFADKEKDFYGMDSKAVILVDRNIGGDGLSLNEKLELAKKNDVAAVFVVLEDYREKLILGKHRLMGKRMFLEDYIEKSSIPVFYISSTTAENILPSFSYTKFVKKGTYKKAELKNELHLIIDKPTEKLVGENILAFIPGTDLKEELLVITAHYDHIGMNDSAIFNGADDNGTGTVALLEIAEAFMKAKKEGHGPRRSILIMPVSGEEKGLLGSYYYSQNPVFPLGHTMANINVDMIGRIDEKHKDQPNYIYLIGADRLSQDLHDISKTVATENFDIELDYTYNAPDDPNRYYYRSDHYNFAKNNIPSVFYFSGVHEDYHKASDTVDKIQFDKVELISRLIFVTAWELANREQPLKLKDKSN